MLGALLFVSMLAMLVSLQLFQITSEGLAKRALRRATAALTEADLLVARQYEDLRARAEEVDQGDSLALEDYPIAATFSPEEVLAGSEETLRDELLGRSADALYEDGTGALRADAEDAGDIGVFSVAGLTDSGLGFLRSRNHAILALLTALFATASAGLAVGFAMCWRGGARVAAPAAAVALAAAPVLVAGIIVRLCADTAGDDEYLRSEMLAIVEELALVPIRNGAAFLVGGLAVATVALALGMLTVRRDDVQV